jgi:DNA polymerase III subunit epsilon
MEVTKWPNRSVRAAFPRRASESLTSMCDRLVLDSSERDDRHGALLDAHMTADALILLEHRLKHGENGAPRSWTSTRQA